MEAPFAMIDAPRVKMSPPVLRSVLLSRLSDAFFRAHLELKCLAFDTVIFQVACDQFESKL